VTEKEIQQQLDQEVCDTDFVMEVCTDHGAEEQQSWELKVEGSPPLGV